MIKIFILLLVAAHQVFALGQQVTLLQNQPIYIQYYNTGSTAQSVYITAVEMQTKKKASVQLTTSDKDQKILNGYFRIQMDMNKTPSQILEFRTKAGIALYAHVIPNTNSSEKAL
ncbi:MAG: hypothetical protein KDD45_07985, partial [Bdellovibrionales bacterium]|nr:hypothetical protein [Bdellovibrionales bacterium]